MYYLDLLPGYYVFEGEKAERVLPACSNLLKLTMSILRYDLVNPAAAGYEANNYQEDVIFDIDIFQSKALFRPLLRHYKITNLNDFIMCFKGKRFFVFIDEKGKMQGMLSIKNNINIYNSKND